MEEWKTYKLGDLLTIKYGKDHKSLADGSVPAYGSGGLMRMVEKPIYDKPSILIPRKGSLNNILYVQTPFWTVDTMFWTIINTNLVLPHYLYYSIKDIDFASLNVGSAVPSLTCPIIEAIEIKIPSIEDQERILSFLEPIDNKIELNNRINHNLEEQAQAVFDRIFDSSNSQSCCLSSIAYINPTRSIQKNKIARCVEMSYLSTSGSFPLGWDFKPYTGGMKFINGDTLMARITPCLENGKVAYVNFLENDEVAFGSTEYIVLHTKDGYPNEMLYFLTRNKAFIDYATKNMNGSSGRQRVSGDAIGNYEIPVLSDDTIRELSIISAAAMKQILKNSTESMALASTRDTLLPQLMSGKLNINEIDC